MIVYHEKEPEYSATLQDINRPITDRISALFCLRTIGSVEACEGLIKAFDLEDRSDLLRHEICYCLGQLNKSPEHVKIILSFFERILKGDYTKIVLHEAVEALGNVSEENNLQLLDRFAEEKDGILYETCFLTQKLVEWKGATQNGKLESLNLSKLRCATNDPAPPYNFKREPKYADVKFLESMILDNEKYDLFERYRALFTLREINTEEAAIAVCQCLKPENSINCSELLKHEVAFVLGQMEEVFKPAVPYLLECVENPDEAPIVRHEVLICLGMNLDEKSRIDHFLTNPDLIVSQSCEAAIQLIEYRQKCEEEERLKQEKEASG